MGEKTAIEWTDHTFNPWIGCTNVSAACDHCYAESLARRYGWAKWGPGEARQRTSLANWHKPATWNAAARKAGVRRKVFCASLSDWADAEVPDAWRDDLFEQVIVPNADLDFLLLTKRPQVAKKYLAKRGVPSNVWLGTTVEDQKMADLRIPALLSIPAKMHFLSCEPLLGPIELTNLRDGTFDALTGCGDRERLDEWEPTPRISWIIAGGESGLHARPSHPAWLRSLRDQCQAAGASFFFKQWGGRTPKAGGKELDGREWCEFPVAA